MVNPCCDVDNNSLPCVVMIFYGCRMMWVSKRLQLKTWCPKQEREVAALRTAKFVEDEDRTYLSETYNMRLRMTLGREHTTVWIEANL